MLNAQYVSTLHLLHHTYTAYTGVPWSIVVRLMHTSAHFYFFKSFSVVPVELKGHPVIQSRQFIKLSSTTFNVCLTCSAVLDATPVGPVGSSIFNSKL